MFESESELLVALQGTAKSVNKVLTNGKIIVKALEKLDTAKSLERQDYMADAIEALRTTDLTTFGCGATQKDLLHALELRLRDLRIHAHHNLIAGLTQGNEKNNSLRIISDNPLVIFINPLTLEVQFEQMKAVWTYAHELLQTTSLDPEEILEAHKSLVDVFRATRIDSQQFWNILKLAYDMVLLKKKEPAGASVDIVELLPPLAWLWPNLAAMKKTAVFPRYLLAYQLQKLRADKLLQNHGLRLELGTATGGSTRNKNNVLFIPMGVSEGQYYLSICFRQA